MKRAFCILCFAMAAVLLLSGCGLIEVQHINPSNGEPTPLPVTASAPAAVPSVDPAPTQTPALTPAPAPTQAPASFAVVSMEKDTPYTFHETTFIFTTEMDEYEWPTTRLLAQEDNGWESAVTYEGDFVGAYYCETENGPCILINTDLGVSDSKTTYVLDGNTLAEGDSRAGSIESIDGGVIRISSYIDILGTYYTTRDYTFGAYFALEPTGEGLFTITEEEDRFIVTSKNLPVQLYENGQYKDETLFTGAELCVTSTDGSSVAHFKTRDGRTGRLAITFNEEWVVLIDGTPAEEWFVELPYAG